MSFFSSIFGGPKTPSLGDNYKSYRDEILETNRPSLSDRQSRKLSNLFGKMLSSGTDPSRLSFEAATLGQQFPGETAFQPGGSVFNKLLEERLSPRGKKETIADANYLAQTILNRPITKEEKRYVKDTRDSDPNLAKFTGRLYSNPEAVAKAFPTDEENRISAYYGRMIPGKDGFTGARYGLNINPIEYTGGIG
jgi:hypothetical protein